jgi:toxoflavin biosynthesis protein ToxD
MQIEFNTIPGGWMRMGSDAGETESFMQQFDHVIRTFGSHEVHEWLRKQTPSFSVEVLTFEMAVGLITRGQFREHERAMLLSPSDLTSGDPDLPVEGVSFEQARAFCTWLSNVRGESILIPSEVEWEYAASSRGRFAFPWGDEWDPRCANTAEAGPGQATKTGMFSRGRSMEGIEDLAGNLEEWTRTPYQPYSGGTFVRDHIFLEQGDAYKILRGGCYALNGDLCWAKRRHGFRANYAITGLRVVRHIA